jgi:hypothetical protein
MSFSIHQNTANPPCGLDIMHIVSFLEELEYKELPDKLDNTWNGFERI